MFSEVDNTIFPDSCEVIEIASQHFVYPIFKCGRSSLHQSMESHGWTFMSQDKIRHIQDPVQVFVRDPRQRFVSGVNTYVQHVADQDLDLDLHTTLYFVNHYLFLNRHYAPQFFWLLNLARHVPDVRAKLCHVTEISALTSKHSRGEVVPVTPELQQRIESFDWSKLDLYFYLDQILLDHVGQTIKVTDLVDHVRINHAQLYELVFQKTLDILNVLPKT